MEKFDVSYRIDDEETQSLVAQLVPASRPEHASLEYAEPSDDRTLSLMCQLGGEATGIIPWLIVRTHRWSHRKHWQRGMYLKDAQHGSALIELIKRDELAISVRGMYPSYLMSVLSDTVSYLVRSRWPGLGFSMAVPCPHRDAQGRSCPGRFDLDALWVFKSEGDETIPCQQCRQKQNIDGLLTGFESRGNSLHRRLDAIQRQLDLARKERRRMATFASEMSRVFLNAMGSETRECPRLFTLVPVDLNRFNPANIGKCAFRITLWCEMPDCQHPVSPIGSGGNGEYVVKKPKAWLVRIAPYASLVARTLRTIVPIAGATLKAVLDESLLENLSPSLDIMDKVVSTVLRGEFDVGNDMDVDEGPENKVEGAGLREFYALLSEVDSARRWGGLRRVQAPTGDYLWLCPMHYRQFDPGLPVLD